MAFISDGIAEKFIAISLRGKILASYLVPFSSEKCVCWMFSSR